MKRKTVKKLGLNKESLRRLSHEALLRLQGGKGPPTIDTNFEGSRLVGGRYYPCDPK